AFVHADDAACGDLAEECLLGLPPLVGGHGIAGGPACPVVCFPGQRALGRPAVGVTGVRGERDQRGGDQGGVHVSAAEVHRHVAGGLVEFGAAGDAGGGPGGLVPAVGDQHLAGAGGRGNGGEQFASVADSGQVEAGEVQSGGGGVDVCVDEAGRHE